MYPKNDKKSISPDARSDTKIDLFIILAILALMIVPVIVNFGFRLNAGDGQIELLISSGFEELFGRETAESLLREFEERNPDMRISQAVAGEKNKEPDIFIFDDGEYNALAAAGTLVSLSPYLHTESGAEQSAIPIVSFMDLLFYNIELLKAAGFDRPPKTRDEFIAYAKAVPSASGFPNDNQALYRDVFSWIWAAGGGFWSSSTPQFNNKAVTADISFLGRLNREARSFETTGAERLEEFAQGKTALMIASTRDISALRKKMGDDTFGITTIPGSAGKYSVCLSGFYAGISSACAYSDEAWRFLLFLAEQSPLIGAGLKAVPGGISDFPFRDYMKDDPFYSKAWDIFESSEIVQGFTGKAGGKEFEDIAREELRIFFESSRSAEETTAAIQRRWDAVPLPLDRE